MDSGTFIQTHRVFTFDEAARALRPGGGRRAALKRLLYHVGRGRLKPIARGVYASVPPGADPRRFQPDRYLVAAAVRPDGIFSSHAALELLGAAHSEWNVCTLVTTRRRAPLQIDGVRVEFIKPPAPLLDGRRLFVGVRKIARADRMLRVAGPERCLVEGFREPGRAGGVEELVESAAGFPALDLRLLRRLLWIYGEKTLWAAVGWFLERHRSDFAVPERYLASLGGCRPRSPQYLLRGQRGGVLARRWNLILPESVTRAREPDER